jgi:hypothetical protein
MSGQEISVDNQWERFDWKRRLAKSVIGEQNARELMRPVQLSQASLEGVLTSAGRANKAYLRQFKDIHRGQRCVIIGVALSRCRAVALSMTLAAGEEA